MLQRLSDPVADEIAAYSQLCDLNECIIQLVYNSIDAQASLIIVKFDPHIFYLEIIDNGKGIELQNFQNIGKKQPMQTKNPLLYGQRGKFLKNLIEISDRVEITSKNYSKIFFKKSSYMAKISQDENNFGTVVRAFNIFGDHQLRQNLVVFDVKKFVSCLKILSLVNFKIKFYAENLGENIIVFNSNQCWSLLDQYKNFIDFHSFLKEHYFETQDLKIYAIFIDYQKKTNYLFFNNFYLKNEIYYQLINSVLGHNQFNYCLLVTWNCLEYTMCHYGNYKSLIQFHHYQIDLNFKTIIKNFVQSFRNKIGMDKRDEKKTPALNSSPKIEPEELKNSRASKTVKFKITSKKSLNFDFKNFQSKKLRINKNFVKLNHPSFVTQFKAKYGLNKITKKLNLKIKKDQFTQTESEKIKDNWTRFWNENGTEFYVNKLNGFSTFDIELVKDSPIRLERTNKVLKFNNQINESNYDQLVTDVHQKVTKKWFLKENLQNFQSTSEFKIDKNIFQNLKIMGQIDQKFIASFNIVKSNSFSCVFVYLFDQHACHERIRLEYLLSKNIINNLIICDNVKNLIELKLNVISPNVYEIFSKRIKKLGFEIKKDSGKFYLVKVPKFLVQKVDRNENEFVKKINQFVESELDKSYDQKFVSESDRLTLSKIPAQLMDFFNTEACRGAIKFGDKLNSGFCEELIKKLSFCQMPFSCAHGRPTIVPIKQMFKKDIGKKKPNLKKLFNDF